MIRSLRTSLPTTRYAFRCYATEATTTAPKASVKLIAEIRKRVAGTSLIKAREALQASNNSLPAALEWLEKDLAVSGASKQTKLADRVTGEGLIATAVLSKGGWDAKGRPLGVRAAMVELNCETDFVARNEIFVKLAMYVAYSAAFLGEKGKAQAELGDALLVAGDGQGQLVSEAIRNAVAKLGEKIALKRTQVVVMDPTTPSEALAIGSYVHGAAPTPAGATGHSEHVSIQAGRIGSLVQLGIRSGTPVGEVEALGKSLAMQVVGFPTTSIKGLEVKEMGDSESEALYDQPFMVRGTDSSVGQVLKEFGSGVEVQNFHKWTVGETAAE